MPFKRHLPQSQQCRQQTHSRQKGKRGKEENSEKDKGGKWGIGKTTKPGKWRK
jgi:hypothetical protein